LQAQITREKYGIIDTVTKKSVAAWKTGQVIRLSSKEQYYWCTDCNITILLDVEDEGYYHLMVKTNEATPLV
jgi:hypothetical protein